MHPTEIVGRGAPEAEGPPRDLVRGLGLFDGTMLVAGSMIGSGIFMVSADIARHVGSAGWLLAVWAATGVLTIAGALSYGELAAMMPRAGGQYVFLRESFSPFVGFLYGWAFFLVIQTGTIAAVAVAFSKFIGVLAPAVSERNWIVEPIHLGGAYALSLSVQQLVAIVLILVLTLINTRGLILGKTIQNVFTVTKVASLAALILLGLTFGYDPGVVERNFADAWRPAGVKLIQPELTMFHAVSASMGAFGLFVAFCVAQVGSLFSSDSWNNVTFTAGEVKDPRRNVPLSLALGTILVIGLYFLANVAYLVTLPIEAIQAAPEDRVGTAALHAMFGDVGAAVMAAAIILSTFGCNNGLVLSGARVYYAMARDGLFFGAVRKLNARRVPARALAFQGVWASLLLLPLTVSRDEKGAAVYGNLYSNLLDYVVSTVLIFYILTILGIFILRRRRPQAERPYRAIGYPLVQALYIAGAGAILFVLIVYKTQMTWPGLLLVLTGIPVYFLWSPGARLAGETGPDNAFAENS